MERIEDSLLSIPPAKQPPLSRGLLKVCQKTAHPASYTGDVVTTYAYVTGESKTLPFIAGRVQKIVDIIQSEGFSAKKCFAVLARTALLAKKYLSDPSNYVDALFPALQASLSVPNVIGYYEEYQEAKTFEEHYQAILKLTGEIATCLFYIAQAGASLAFTKVSRPVYVSLNSVIYLSLLGQTAFERPETALTMEQQLHTPTQFIGI